MVAFDTDVLTGILRGHDALVRRASSIPREQQTVPTIVLEEIFRGRLNAIRKAESGKSSISLERSYHLFELTFLKLRHIQMLSFTKEAKEIFEGWKSAKVRVGTKDMQIAATCVAHNTLLITRNRRDFERIPELRVEFW